MNESPSTLTSLFREAGLRHADSICVISENGSYSYAQLRDLSVNLASLLAAGSSGSGARIGILLPSSWQFIVSVWGAVLADLVFLPLDPDIGRDNLEHILTNCPLEQLIIDKRALPRLEGIDRRLHPSRVLICDSGAKPGEGQVADSFENGILRPGVSMPSNALPAATDLISISFTSGSTGVPKGVMHSHQSWLCGALSTADYFQVGAHDRILIPLPLAHAYSFRHMLAYLSRGGTLLLARDFLSGLKLLGSANPNALLLVPSAINIILRQFVEKLRQGSHSLKLISIGTAAIDDEQIEQLKTILPNVDLHLPYGLTEARVGFLEQSKPRMLKDICRGMTVRLERESGLFCQPGETGELVISGDGLMLGYWGMSSERQQDLRSSGFRTGDLGRLESGGRITLLGRLDDIVNVGGKKVAPLEVEEVINRHPNVVESAVLGIADPQAVMGKQLAALVTVVPEHSCSEEALIDYLRQRLEPHKIPMLIRFTGSLPKSSSGKIMKSDLARLFSLPQEQTKNSVRTHEPG